MTTRMPSKAASSSSSSRRALLSAPLDLNEPLIVPLSTRSFAPQFASLYHFRLRKLKGVKRDGGGLLKKAKERWGDGSAAGSAMQRGSHTRTRVQNGKRKNSAHDEEEDEEMMEDEAAAAEEEEEEKEEEEKERSSRDRVQYVERILDIDQGKMMVVCGIVYCSMRLKPDVLEDLTREQYLPPVPARTTYADNATDEIFLEDESGRIRLVGGTAMHASADSQASTSAPQNSRSWRDSLVTGVVCAVLGTETRAGDFDVVDVVLPGIPRSLAKSDAKSRDEAMDVDGEKGEWVAFVSGIEVGDEKAFETKEEEGTSASASDGQEDDGLGMLRNELLAEWLRGETLSEIDAGVSVRDVSALILAGNSCAVPSALRTVENKAGRPRAFNTNPLDHYLAALTQSIQVQILPGARDPAGLAMPQQPLHKALFPRSAGSAEGSNALIRATNPAWSAFGNALILGTSGQNIDDLFKYVEGGTDEDRLRMACNTLRWGHLAPTAPDTLCCYPFTDRDPFLITRSPHIYFVGNQPRFATTLYEHEHEPESEQGQQPCKRNEGSEGGATRTRVLLLPSFNKTGTVVLVHRSTLQVKKVHILPPL